MKPRWATPEDDAALLALMRACPMTGEVSLYVDRTPSYFTLSRLQGEGAHVCVIDGADGALVAAAAVAPLGELFVHGRPRPVFYACDLRIAPAYRGGRVLKRLYDFLTRWGVAQGWDLGISTVMADNTAMAPVISGKAALLPYLPVSTMRNYMVPFWLPRRPVPGIEVRAATPADVPAMVALWNRLQAAKLFSPRWSEAGLRARVAATPGLSLEAYRLALIDGRLVGLLSVWDQQRFKRLVVLRYAESMARMRHWYNPCARLLGLAGLPAPGEPLPYLYATEPCAVSPEVLKALYIDVHNQYRGHGYVYFSTMLDRRDPLNAALKGFVYQRVDISLYALDPLRHWTPKAFADGVAYFDPALV